MRHLPGRLAALVCGIVVLLAGGPEAQRGAGSAGPSIPALSYSCPHHPDVIESEPGTCPLCKMALVPVRLGAAWTCPVHPATVADAAGTCPVCRRQLVPVTVSVSWTCSGATTTFLEPGLCLDGRPRVRAQALRPHGDHNPRHGGVFFMAQDNWHHVEGTYPVAGVFRLYVYDDYARPLSEARLREVRGRVVTRERFDPATRRTIEEASFPLRPARGGGYLEARVDRESLPAEMTAKIRVGAEAAEYRFDFTFTTFSSAPAPSAAPVAARTSGRSEAAAPGRDAERTAPAPPAGRAAAAPASSAAAPAAAPAVATATPDSPATAPAGDAVPDPDAPAPDPALAVLPIPDTVEAIVEQLRARRGHVAALIARGDFTAVWVPAFAARDLAIALERHLDHLDAAVRDDAGPALQRTVRLAWLLDAHGDTGNREQLDAAYAAFSSSIDVILAAFEHLHHR